MLLRSDPGFGSMETGSAMPRRDAPEWPDWVGWVESGESTCQSFGEVWSWSVAKKWGDVASWGDLCRAEMLENIVDWGSGPEKLKVQEKESS